MWACGRRRSPGFRADPAAPSRLATASQWHALARGRGTSPGTVAGPRRFCTGFPCHRPMTAPSYRSATLRNEPMTINLTRIYTKLGDGGETHLGDMSRVPKTDPRIEAYGEVDELGAHLGVALTLPELPPRTATWLRRIQNDLFDVGADLAVPASDTR